jgi:hypothetical protein
MLLVAVRAEATPTPTPVLTPTPTRTVTPTPVPTITAAADQRGYVDYAQRADANGRMTACSGCQVSWRKFADASYPVGQTVTAKLATGRFQIPTLTDSGLYCFRTTATGYSEEHCEWVDVTDGQYRHCVATDNAQTRCCETVQSGNPEGVWVGRSQCDYYINATNGDRYRFTGTANTRTGWVLDAGGSGGGGGGGSGTVTSVDLASGTSALVTSGGPVSGSGTLTVDFAPSVGANRVIGTGNGGGKPAVIVLGVNHLPTMTSTELRSKVSDPTGTGASVFGTAPTLTGPIIATTTVAS